MENPNQEGTAMDGSIAPEPMVSVILLSYNHAPYLKECLEGVLLQKTTYPFEVLLADDCSSDNSRDILDEYVQKRPDVFKKCYTEKNLGSTRNLEHAFKQARGNYIFGLEGDDYWTNPNKIQVQADFLENNRHCPMVATRCWIKDETTGRNFGIKLSQTNLYFDGEAFYLTTPEIIEYNICGNYSTAAYRKSVFESFGPSIFDHTLHDWCINLIMSDRGPVALLQDVMSVYRITGKGIWTCLSQLEKLRGQLAVIDEYNVLLGHRYQEEFDKFRENVEHALKSPEELKELEIRRFNQMDSQSSFLKSKIRYSSLNGKVAAALKSALPEPMYVLLRESWRSLFSWKS